MGDRLVGKVAVVTGGGSGVGRAYVHALAAEGARIVVNDLGTGTQGTERNSRIADKVVEEIRSKGGEAVADYGDVSDFDAVGEMMQAALNNFGRLDIVVANAGNIRPCLLYEASQEDWDRTFSIHANGSFYCYRHAAPILMKQGGGTIITTGAAAGEGLPGRIGMDMPAYPKLGAYRAAKAAILVLTLNAASEMLPYNINVNTIMPGAISTRMVDTFYSSIADRGLSNEGIPAGFVDPSPPEAVPPLGVFLSTDAGRHITGRVFSNVYKNELRVARAPAVNDTLSTRDAIWSVDELSEVLPRWLANDGFPSPDGTSA